jgi:hypothetical protein
MSMEAFSREGLLSLLESVESAISELQSRNEPRPEGVISATPSASTRPSNNIAMVWHQHSGANSIWLLRPHRLPSN